MNPLYFSGPQFLLFYALLLGISFCFVYLYWSTCGPGTRTIRPLTSPYLIAYLRGGPKEAVKIAGATLAHRGLLKVDDDRIVCKSFSARSVSDPLERAVLEACSAEPKLHELTKSKASSVADTLFFNALAEQGLLLTHKESTQFTYYKIGTVLLLGIIAFAKVGYALSQGRHNIQFLVVLSLSGMVVLSIIKLWRTPIGSAALKNLRVLFSRLKSLPHTLTDPAQNKQFSFLVAVFGLSVLSEGEHPFVRAFRPKAGNNSGCGSSCGSSSSSCGGGDGGGCGGCGGD